MPYNVTTLAGLALNSGSTDGTGSAARFFTLFGICFDGTNLYATDGNTGVPPQYGSIRKITPAGVVTTPITGADILSDICTDDTYLYVLDDASQKVLKIPISNMTPSNLTASVFQYYDSGICTDGTNLFIINRDVVIQIVIATGNATILAGQAATPGYVDGTGTAARFDSLGGICTDGVNLYLSDYNNYVIRKIVISTAVVTTFAGQAGIPGGADGSGLAASFSSPVGICIDGANLYVCDDAMIRQIAISGAVVTTIAGQYGNYGSADGLGSAASFKNPHGICAAGGGVYYICDTGNFNIRKIVYSAPPPPPPVISGLPKKAVVIPKQPTVTFTATPVMREFSVKTNETAEINREFAKVRDSISKFRVTAKVNK